MGAWPRPDDPSPRGSDIDLGRGVSARDDVYSDRIRCDHPNAGVSARWLVARLREMARERGRRRLVIFCGRSMAEALFVEGLELEASIPGYYAGSEACFVLADWPGGTLQVDAEALAPVDELIAGAVAKRRSGAVVKTRRAGLADAPAIAALITQCFEHYPTPSGVPSYVAQAIMDGIPFRVVDQEGAVVACASADLVRAAHTAELTDCATRPDFRGRGLMQALLLGLMEDLSALGYATAYTLARAQEPGMNIAFKRLGFEWNGRMVSSCRIGSGLEDMNVWSRVL
ncbi:MAG: putative beta-lysine N-acetyltransferase [Cognaticolwellia sp.]|jgi:putative beta-lysine N-acetyltransferase